MMNGYTNRRQKMMKDRLLKFVNQAAQKIVLKGWKIWKTCILLPEVDDLQVKKT